VASTFGRLLRQYRTAAGFSQEHLAGLARISVESVGALERGTRRAPYRDTIALLADALKLDVDAREALEAAAHAARSRRTHLPADTEAPPSNPHLPLQSTSFIGRSDDIRAITALLAESRLVTITGSGGVGKTRAAIEVAARIPGSRRRDIRFVDLSRLTNGALVAGAVAAALDLPGDGAANVPDLVAGLRSSQVFLVLDNCEHLIADVALFVSAALQSCPGLALLAASRERLAVSGEVVYRLPSLAVPPLEAPLTLAEARNYGAIELFVQRAAAIDRSTAFGDSAVPGIVAICRRLDGIPLAIELAAARVGTLGVDALGARLRDGLALSGAPRDLPARQQTMQATIRWSYDLLNDAERLVLQRLSIFVGGFTLAAAESVCGAEGIARSDVADLVSSLADKSLLTVTRSEKYVRFGLLDSVRSFAFDRLQEAGQLELFTQRHAEWVAAFADWVDASRANFPERRLRLEVDPELENARAAITWGHERNTEEGGVLAGRVVGGLRTIWLTSGRRAECKRLAAAALDVIDGDRHPRVVAPLFRALVQAADGLELIELVDRAKLAFERIGDRMAVALLLSHVGDLHRRHGFLEEAEAAIQEAAEIFLAEGLPLLMPYTSFLQNRLVLRAVQGRYEEALADADEATAIVKSLGDEDALQWEWHRAGVEFLQGETATAIARLERGIERALAHPAGHEKFRSYAYSLLAAFRITSGESELAYVAASEALRRSLNHNPSDGVLLTVIELLGLVAATRGEVARGARLVGKADSRVEPPSYRLELWGCMLPDLRRRLLEDAAKREHASPEDMERWKAEGRAFTMERAIAEALRV
jgi:predicted ATPase/DNA-binding XRE family transcriptional regulator